jgi:hypothetical protein
MLGFHSLSEYPISTIYQIRILWESDIITPETWNPANIGSTSWTPYSVASFTWTTQSTASSDGYLLTDVGGDYLTDEANNRLTLSDTWTPNTTNPATWTEH